MSAEPEKTPASKPKPTKQEIRLERIAAITTMLETIDNNTLQVEVLQRKLALLKEKQQLLTRHIKSLTKGMGRLGDSISNSKALRENKDYTNAVSKIPNIESYRHQKDVTNREIAQTKHLLNRLMPRKARIMFALSNFWKNLTSRAAPEIPTVPSTRVYKNNPKNDIIKNIGARLEAMREPRPASTSSMQSSSSAATAPNVVKRQSIP